MLSGKWQQVCLSLNVLSQSCTKPDILCPVMKEAMYMLYWFITIDKCIGKYANLNALSDYHISVYQMLSQYIMFLSPSKPIVLLCFSGMSISIPLYSVIFLINYTYQVQ